MTTGNHFTADGGPHKLARILAVADGLRRIGEFESAEMLDAYAKQRQSPRLPNGWLLDIEVGPALAIHLTDPDGKWIGLLPNSESPRDKKLYEFFKAMKS